MGMQSITIGTLMQQGTGIKPGPMSPKAAEEEYATALSLLTGEQYELLPEQDHEQADPPPAPLYTIRYVLRTNPTTVKVLGIFYVVEGVIYKAPCVRSLMKANVTRTIQGLAEACQELSVCARYDPSTGYIWDFEGDDEDDYIEKMESARKKRARRVLDHRKPGE